MLAVYGALSLWLGWLGLTYPYQLDYGEGIVLWFARELIQGHSIYDRALMASSNYPPLAMVLSALLMPILGNGYLAGRLLNFGSAIVVAALIYRIVKVETQDRQAGMLAALFFFGSTYIYHWIPVFRVDLIGLALTIAGIYFAWKRERSTDPGREKFYLVLFTGAFLLALYTKHTLVAAPAAAFLALARESKRVAIIYALALASIGGGIYFAMDLATYGGFTFGLIDSNATVFLPAQLGTLIGSFAETYLVMIGLTAWSWVGRVRAGQTGVLEVYFVTTFATLVFVGRVGAWENYFFEAITLVCVFAGFKISNLLHLTGRSRSVSFILPLLLLVQLLLYTTEHDPRVAAGLVAQDFPANQQLGALLARTNGTIISEDMGALVTSGKPVAYYTFQYASLARSGQWDQSWESNGLRDGLFPLVILEQGTRENVDHYRRFTREFVSSLDRYYAQTQTIGKYEVYTPAPLSHVQSANFGGEIALVGWSASSEALSAGPLNLQIVWQAQKVMRQRFSTFVHLENAKGEKVSQQDKEPLGGAYPTTRWAGGEMVREVYALSIPASLSAGKYVLQVGWYDPETGVRLTVPGSANDSIELTTFEVR